MERKIRSILFYEVTGNAPFHTQYTRTARHQRSHWGTFPPGKVFRAFPRRGLFLLSQPDHIAVSHEVADAVAHQDIIEALPGGQLRHRFFVVA